jgi:hypothetical protein
MYIVAFTIIVLIIIYFVNYRNNISGGAETNSKYAWVTLVMKGNAYIPGALALAQSLRSVGTKHKIVCMVTDDVTDYEELKLLFDEVVNIKYTDINPLTKSKFNDRYDTWVTQSATKWRCLELTQFDKVMFVDSDVVFIKNFDYIFNLKCPAATFFNNWKDKKYCNNNFDIPDNIILDHIKTDYGPLATMILLPTIKNCDFGSWVNAYFNVHIDSKSTYDEQTIGEYLIYKKYKWHCIDYKYNYMINKNTLFTNKQDIPHILHYYNKKPWIYDDGNTLFNYVYWTYLYNACKDHEQLKKYITKHNLPKNEIDNCPICKFKGKKHNHKLITSTGKIVCDLYK